MMVAMWVFAGLALALGVGHISARAVCRRRGHRWSPEVRMFSDGTDTLSTRCRRCRIWAGQE